MSGIMQPFATLDLMTINKETWLLHADFEVLIHVMDYSKLSQDTENSYYSVLEHKAVLFGIDDLEPCLSIYFSLGNPKRTTALAIFSQM
jgi:hypothetical protein